MELYRYLPGCSEGDSASVIDTNAGEGQVSDDAIHRAQVVGAEMEFCRDATDLAGLRSAVVRSSFWVSPIAVGRIQLALNVKVVAIINLGNGEYGIIYDELPGGVIDFAPESYVAVRQDESHCALMAGESERNLPLYIELPVEIRCRMARRGFFASTRYAQIAATHSKPTPPGAEISEAPEQKGGQDQATIEAAIPTPNNPGGVGHGQVSSMAVEEASAMYLIDCASAWNSGGSDCFPLFLEQATVHSAYPKRVLLSGPMTAGDLEFYHAILAQCDPC